MANGADRPERSAAGFRWWWILLAVIVLVAVDQITKVWAVAALTDGPILLIGDSVRFELTRNSGTAFSRLQGYTPVVAILAVIITVFLMRAVQRASDRWIVVGLVLVLAGALGNLCDRFVRSPGFLRGHVVDFVAVGWFPVFNFADACVTVGAVILVVRTLFGPVAHPEQPAEPGSGPTHGRP